MTIPDGWQLVPKVPTEEMARAAGFDPDEGFSILGVSEEAAREAIHRAIAAAPPAPTDPEMETGKEAPGVAGATYRLLSRFDWRETTSWARGEMLRSTPPPTVFDVAAGCIASVCLQVVGLFGRTQIRDAARAIMTKASLILEDDIQKLLAAKKEETVLHRGIRLVSDR